MAEEEVQYSYEYWDCQCGTKALRGDVMVCPGCGHPRDADIKFYRQEDKVEVITADKQLERFKAGPDWICSFCQELNSDLDKQCRGCGHVRFKSDENYLEHQADSVKPGPSAPTKDDAKNTWAMIVLAAFLTMIFGGGFCWWSSLTRPVEYEVTKVHWQRSIPVQRYQWISRESWQNDVSGGDVVRLSQSREVRSYESRPVGTRTEHYTESESYQSGTRDETSSTYESLGNGAGRTVTTHRSVPVYSTRTVDKTRTVPVYKDFPIYDTKIKYRAKVYTTVRTEKAGADDNKPIWPEVTLGSGLDKKPDHEEVRQESYYVTETKCHSQDKGPQSHGHETTAEDFTTKYILGKHISYLVNNRGDITGEAEATSSAQKHAK